MKHHNKFMKSALSIFFALIFQPVSPLFSAGPPMLGEILTKTEANYQKVQAFTATFRQATTSAAAGTVTPGEASGRVYYAKPKQMRWEYDKPEEQVFVANNQFAWIYVRGENQISLFDANRLFASPLAQTFFEGAVGLKNHFDITLDSGQSTKSSAVLKLIPKKEDPSIKLLFLRIDLQSFRISRIESHDILGNTNRITLESWTPKPGIDPKLFQLEVPPGSKLFDPDGREFPPAEVEQLKSRISSGK